MSTIRPTWLVRRTKVVAVYRAAFHQHMRTDIRGCNDNVVAQNQEFRLSPSRLHTGSAVVRQLLGRPRRLSGHGPASTLPPPSENSRALPLKHGDRMNFL